MKTMCLIAMMTLAAMSAIADPGSTYESTDKLNGLSLFLTLGTRPFQLKSSDIYFRYVDESPSMDNMVADIDLKESLFSTSIKVGAQYRIPAGIFFKVLFDGYIGQARGMSADFGVGYEAGKQKFHFRPQAMFSYGGHGVKLGELYQNDVFIEVNGTRFYSPSVDVMLKSRHFVFSPQLEFAGDVAPHFEILGGVGYNLAISKGSPYLQFKGDDIDSEAVSASESITAPNVYLAYEGDRMKSAFIGLNHVFFHIGFAYNF